MMVAWWKRREVKRTIPIEISTRNFPNLLLAVPFMYHAFSLQNVEDIVTIVWQGNIVAGVGLALRHHTTFAGVVAADKSSNDRGQKLLSDIEK